MYSIMYSIIWEDPEVGWSLAAPRPQQQQQHTLEFVIKTELGPNADLNS